MLHAKFCRPRRGAVRAFAVALFRGGAVVLPIAVQTACRGEQTVNGTTVDRWFADPRARDLADAAGRGDADRVAALIRAGADPNAAGRDGVTPLVWALGRHSRGGVRALLAHGADPNAKGTPALHALTLAASADDPELLRALLDAKGDPSACDSGGDPLLRTAIMHRRIENVRLLAGRGANLNALDRGHSTPVLTAADTDQWDVVALLLERGADPNIPDNGGGTVANTLEDEETGRVGSDPAQASVRERVRKLLVARGVRFPAEPPEAVRKRVFGLDNPIDRRIAEEDAVRDSLARDSAATRPRP